MPEQSRKPLSGLSSIFANLKMRGKLLIGFCSVIFVFTVVIGLAFWNFVKIGHEIHMMEESAQELALASNIEIQFLKMSRAARAFVQKGDEKSEQDSLKYEKTTKQALEEARAGIKIESHIKLVDEIATAFKNYTNDYVRVIELKKEFKRLVSDELEPTADKMIYDLDELIKDADAEDNTPLRRAVVDAREHAFLIQIETNRLLFEGKQEYAKKIADEFIAFDATMKKAQPELHTDHERELYKELEDLLKKNQTIFEKTLRDQTELNNTMDVVMPQFAAIVLKDSEELAHLAAEHEHEVAEQAAHEIQQAEIQLVVFALIGITLGLLMTWLLTSMIGKPIQGMTVFMTKVADGNLDEDVPAVGRKDEIGEMALAVNTFKNNMIANKRLEQEQSEADAKKRERAEKVAQLIKSFQEQSEGMLKQVATAVSHIEKSASQSGHETTETGSRSFEVAEAAERTAFNIDSTAAAAEELSASVSEIATQVTQSSQIATDAVREIDAATDMVRGLDTASQNITEVVELISAIAEQTNLLALNATIEAARAGDAGKGFAVVASEVKNLATQTAKATEQISSMIGTIQGSTGNSVQAIERIGKVIGEINSMATIIASAVEEQNAATQEIARTASTVSADANIVLGSVGALTLSSARSSGKSVSMLWNAQSLNTTMTAFSGEITDFLNSVAED